MSVLNEQGFVDAPFEEPRSFVDRQGLNPIIFTLLVLAALFFLYQIVGGIISFVLLGGEMKLDRTNVDLMRGATMVAQILFLCLPTVLAARLISRSRSAVFPFHPPTLRESIYSVISLIALQRVMDTYMFFQNLIPVPESLTKILEPFKTLMESMVKTMVKAESVPELMFVLLVVALVPAFVEEMVFRGFVIASFAKRWTPVRAAVVGGMIFGAYHLNPFELIPLMGLGIFLGLLRVSSGSLFLPMAAHFLNNFMAVLAVYLRLDEIPALNPTDVTREAITSMAFQAALFGGIFLFAFNAYLRAAREHQIERRGS